MLRVPRARPRAARSSSRPGAVVACVATLLGAALAALGVGCGAGETHAGRHVTLHAPHGAAVCPESIGDADRYVASVAAYLHAPVPRVTYTWHGDAASAARACGGGARACSTRAGTVDAPVWMMHHEVVHTIALPLGNPPPFLSEGLAEALSGYLPEHPLPRDADFETVLTLEGWRRNGGRYYRASGGFVRYLLWHYGPRALRQLYTTIPFAADDATLRAGFRAVTGDALDDALAAWRAAPAEMVARVPVPVGVAECDAPGVAAPAAGGAVEGVTEASLCQQHDTPFLEGRTRVGVDLPAAGVYVFEHDAPRFRAQVYRCDDHRAWLGAPHGDGRAPPPTRLVLALGAGRYALALNPVDQDDAAAPRDGAGARREAVRWTLASRGTGAACETAPRVALTRASPRVLFYGRPRDWPRSFLRVPGDVPGWSVHLAVEVPGPGALRVLRAAPFRQGYVSVCEPACADGCPTLYVFDWAQTMRVTGGAPVGLRVNGLEGNDEVAFELAWEPAT